MKGHITYQRLYGLILLLRFIFLSDTLSLKGRKLDFYGRRDAYVSLTNTIPELGQFTACTDLVVVDDNSSYWLAFSYITKNTLLGREDIDLGLAGDHQQLILYNLGKTFNIRYHLTPFQWHTTCLIWDGVKGRLELFLNKERILVMTDQPHSLKPNGTLVLGHFPKNGDGQVTKVVPRFTGSLYHFQLWDRILESEELMKCLEGNVVSWEEDVWLVNKVIPTVDRRLRCFVSENMTIQETSTTFSQQIDLTTPSQITGLKPQKTEHSSTVMSKSMPAFDIDYSTISHSDTTSPVLETMTSSKFLKTSLGETATFAADGFSTSAAMTLPTQSTSIHTTTDSMKITKSPSSESTKTTKMAEAMATETFHPTAATNLLSISGLTKNSIASQTPAIEAQSAVTKTTSLFSTIESTSLSTTSWPKHRSTDIAAFPISTSGQEFISTTARTVSWSTVDETSAISTGIGTASAFPPGSLLISTAAPVESPRNQTASALAMTDREIAFTVHSVMPIETTPALRTVETESTFPNPQDVSLPSMEDAITTSMPKETSSIAFSSMTSSPITGTQSMQTIIDAESTHTALTPGITLAPTVAETMLSPTITGPIYTQNTPTAGEDMLTLISTKSASTSKASESGSTSLTGETAHRFSHRSTTWTSRPGPTLLTSMQTTSTLTFVPNENVTSALHWKTSNADHSSTTANVFTPPEASAKSKATTSMEAAMARHTIAISKSTSPRFSNSSTVSGTTSVTNLPEFQLTTLLTKNIPMSTVAANQLPSTPREMVVLPVNTTFTLADIKLNFSMEESTPKPTQVETNGTSIFGGMMAPVPESATTQRFDATVTRKETTSHHLKGKSTITAVADVSQFSTMLKVTDESAQTVTASVTVSPFPDIEKLTNPLDNKTATTEVGGSWLSTKLMTTTPQSSYNGTPEIFNSTHNYTVLWTSETPEGNSAPSPTSGRMQTFPKPLDASTTVLGVSFTTTTDRTAVSLSSAILPPLTAATHFSVPPTPVTHMFSLPVNVSAVTSAIISTVASNETKMTMSEPSTLGRDSSTSVLSDTSTLLLATMTTALVPPLSQTASTASVAMPTHRDSNYTSEATVISTTMTPTVAPSQSETLRPLTPVATRAKASLPSTPADTVTLSKHTFICSKPSSDSIPVASSTHVISTPSTPVTTPPIFQMEGTSTFVFSFPYTFSSSGDAVSSALGTTENSVVDENMPSHTSANKLPTSVDTAISQSSTRLVNTPVSTQLVAGTSTLSSDKEQMTISLGESHRTMEVTKLSPSENSFISYSQGTSSLGMTDMGFSETMEISSHQTHSLSAIPPGTIPDGDSASYPTSGSAQAVTHTMISSNTVDIHSSEMSSSLGNTAFPSQVVTITTSLFPERESTSALSAYPPKTVEMVTSPFSVTRPVSQHQNTSLEDITTSRTTRILSPVLISTTLSHLPSRTAQSEVTSVASSISESTRTFPKSLSPSTAGLSNANFTVISTDMITTALSIPNVPTTLLGETSMATSIPAYQMSSLPVNITAFTSKKVSDTPAVLTSMSSETTHPDCLKSPSMATSGPLSEISSVTFKESTSSPAAISSDSSTSMGSFSTLLPLTTPRTAMTIGTSTLDVALKTNAEPASKSRVVSFPFTTSEMKEVSSRITPIHTSSPAEPASPPMKTIPVTVMTGLVSSDVGTTASSLLSSKDTEAISSMPKTTLSSLLLTIPQLSQGDETTTLGISPAITNSSLPTGSRARVTDLPNTYSRTPVPASVLLPTPSEHLQTSLNIQVSPSLTDMNSTLELTTNHLSSNAGKMTSRSENTSLTVELTKSATSLNTPAFYPSWTAFSATTPSLISLFYSPHVTKENTEFSTTKVSPTSQMVGFPVMGTRIPSSNTQSLITTSWNTLRTEEYPFPISTTSHVHTPKEMQTETLHFVPGSLSTSEASQAGLVSSDVRTMSSAPKSGILPTFGLSESPSLSTSLRAITTTLADIKHTLEKATTSATHGATHPSNPSIISKATTSPMLTWILSSRPSGSSLATASNSPHAMTSSMTELSKATFPTSDMIPMNPVTKFTTVPFTTGNTTLAQTTTTPTLNSVTTGSPTSSPVSAKITDGSVYIPTSPEASSRTTVTANSRTASLPPSFSGMSMSPSTTSTLAIGSTSLPSPTKTSSWSRIPAASTLSTLITPKPTQDSLVNILTTASTATGTSFPLISTGVKHPSTATVSSLISPSFETIWWDSTSSFLSTETLTSTIEAESTVSFYNIEMSFFVFDEEPRVSITSVINEFVKNWLISIFKDSEFFLANMTIQIKSRKTSKEEMTMYRAILEQREGQGMATISHVPYSYVCQVILKANSSLASEELIIRIRSKIHGNLTHGNFTQDHLTLLVKSEHVVVIKLDPGMCNAEETPSKYKGTYKWLATYPTETAQTRCIKNADGNATRICSVSIQTGKAQWEKPRFKQCKLLQELPDKIVDLPNITISDENVNDVAEHILNLVNDSPTLDEEETKIIVSKVAEISKCDELSMSLTQTVLQIVNAVSEKQKDSASSLYQVSNEILRIIERVGHKMEFSGRTANLTVAKLALAVLRVDHSFKGMAFGIHSYEEGGELEIYLGNVPLERALASIYLPKSLQERIPLNNLQTILFNFFGQTSLFKTQNVTNTLTTCVVSASISDMSIQNLADPVVITLQHIEGNRNYDQVHCAFWDFETNNGLGGWNSSGCKVKETNVNYTICQCDHLTHFGVLMDLSRSTVDAVNERALVLITYTGCGISSIFLGIAIVTYIAFPKLRKDYPSKILINLCTALLMLNLAFLVNSWLSSFQKVGLCITAAVALHYFLLVSLTWMGLEAVHMYFALVRVFNIYIPNYILKFCLVGWGIPAITVTVILSVRKDPYGTLSPTTHFCWIQDDSIFYISVVAYFCLIFLMNLSMFCIVLAQLNSMKSQSQKTRQKMILHDLKGTISLMFLLGLTWGFSFFAWGPVRIFFLYLFAICNTLQGFLIFVFYCVMKENVREQWQTHLCCGWLRMDNSSDGNIRYRVNVGYKKQRLKKAIERKLLTPSLKSTATSSSFKSLASTQGTPSEISFANDDFDEDPYCFSSSSSGMIPNYITRILPVEIKMNSIRKQRLFPNKSQLRCSLSPTHGLEEMLNCETVCSNHTF